MLIKRPPITIKSITLAVAFLMFAFTLVFDSPRVQAAPATFVVTNTNSSGAGSFSQAIISANSNGNSADQDIIEFDIPETGNVTIQPAAQVTISQSVKINGYTQGDASENTLVAPNPFNGIVRVAINNTTSNTLRVTAANVTIQGLSIYGGAVGNVSVESVPNFQLFGSYLGTIQNGLSSQNNASNTKSLILTNAADAKIGGTLASERNIFANCALSCFEAKGAATTGLDVKGNYIGLGADGVTSLDTTPGGVGIVIGSGVSGAIIGGTTLSAGNSIEHNTRGAIEVQDSSDISILGNRIMMNQIRDANGGSANGAGIFFGGVSDSMVGSNGGGRNIVAGNHQGQVTIANSTATNQPSTNIRVTNNYFGVLDDGQTAFSNEWISLSVLDDSQYVIFEDNVIKNNISPSYNPLITPGIYIGENAQSVSSIRNVIYNNDGIGIDDDRPEPIVQLGIPGYTQITEDNGDTAIEYTINVPAGDYRIEFYSNTVADPSGAGEGETFLGYQNITTNNSGLQQFSHTLDGVDHDNLALTATEIDDQSPTGFGQTSEFGAEGTPYTPPPVNADLALTSELLNRQDVARGASLDYKFTLTNNGPDSIDLSGFNGSAPGQNNLVQAILPPQLEYTSVSGANVSCTDLGSGSAGSTVSYLYNHADYSRILCDYTGTSNSLASGQSIVFTITGTIPSNVTESLNFWVYAYGGLHIDDPQESSFSNAISNNQEVIDTFSTDSINNFTAINSLGSNGAVSADLSVISQLINDPTAVTHGATLEYEITLTNNGPDGVDLSDFDGSDPGENNLTQQVLPPQLQYASVSGSQVDCTDLGAGSAGTEVSFFYNHADHSLARCNYMGDPTVLSSGESITFSIFATITNDTSQTLGFPFYTLGGLHEGDPENVFVDSGISNNYELIDVFSYANPINNFANNYSLVADGSIEASFINPQSIGTGDGLQLKATFINNGPSAMDPRIFDSATQNPLDSSIFVGLLPPNLSYESNSNDDVSCTWLGPGSASIASFFNNHEQYSILYCSYTGTNESLASGEQIETTFSLSQIGPQVDFNTYILGAVSLADEDSFQIVQSYYSNDSSSLDALDQLETSGTTNNFTTLYYTVPATSSALLSVGQRLSSTGDNTTHIWLSATFVILLSCTAIVLILKRNQHAQ